MVKARGRNLHFGIREFASGAVANGLALVQDSTVLVDVPDLLRLRARRYPARAMEIPVIAIFTHDSIGVGEDGPTHQPVEQLALPWAIPSLLVMRPADANEVVEAWRTIMPMRHEPVAPVLTRQASPTLDRASMHRLRRGAGWVRARRPGGRRPGGHPHRQRQ